MSPPTTQQNLDAAAFLQNFLLAQQQQQQQKQPLGSGNASAPHVPAQAPQSQAPLPALQQLLFVAQQQQQRPASTTQQPQLDPNMARLLTNALNVAKQQQHAGAPAASVAAPPPQSYQHNMPHQQNFSTHGSVASTSPPTVVPPQHQQHHPNLLASAHLLGSLNPSLAAALMTNALQQSAGLTNLPYSPSQQGSTTPFDLKPPAPASQSIAASKSSSTIWSGASRGVTAGVVSKATTTFPPPTSTTGSLAGQGQSPPLSILSAPTGPPAGAALLHHHPQQHRPPPPNHPITKMQRWTLGQLGKLCLRLLLHFDLACT